MNDRMINDELQPGEAPPATPVTAGDRGGRHLGRVAVIGGSLLLGLGALALVVAGPGTADRFDGGAQMRLANSTGPLADLSAGAGPMGDRDGDGCDRGPRMGARIGGGAHLAAAATAIGVTEADLRTALQGGKTIAAVANEKGVALSTVIAAVVADEKTEIAAALTAGRITQAQADQLTANATQRATDLVNGVRPQGPDGSGGTGWGPGPRMGARIGGGAHLAAAATAIGVTEADLRTALQGGKTIAAVANEKGVALSTVIAAVVADEKTEIAAALTAGRITQAQADQLTANATQRATDLVNGVRPQGPDGMGGHHGHHGDPGVGGFGPGPDGMDGANAPAGAPGSGSAT